MNAQTKSAADSLPRRVRVAKIISGRYAPGTKPMSWSERGAGLEQILTEEGDTIVLYSGGGQSTPAPGWELLLTHQHRSLPGERPAHVWTLYGIGK